MLELITERIENGIEGCHDPMGPIALKLLEVTEIYWEALNEIRCCGKDLRPDSVIAHEAIAKAEELMR